MSVPARPARSITSYSSHHAWANLPGTGCSWENSFRCVVPRDPITAIHIPTLKPRHLQVAPHARGKLQQQRKNLGHQMEACRRRSTSFQSKPVPQQEPLGGPSFGTFVSYAEPVETQAPLCTSLFCTCVGLVGRFDRYSRLTA